MTSHAAAQPQSVSANKIAENMTTKYFCHFKKFLENSFISMKHLYVSEMPTVGGEESGMVRKQPFSVTFVIHGSSALLTERLTSQYYKSFRLWLSTDILSKFLYH